MIDIKEVTNTEEKTRITREIMHALPLYFSPPEDIEKKALIHREYPFFAAFEGERAIGFITLKIHNEYTADVYNLGVLEQYHRQKIGHALINICVDYCKGHGFIYLTVKTLDSSAEYEPYDKTRAFYKSEEFIPLEVFMTFWNKENPCLFLVKRIDLI